MDEAVAERKAERKLTAQMVLDELQLHAFYDPADFFNDNGTMKNINEMSPKGRAVIKTFDVVNLYEGEEQRHCFGQLRKIRTSDKIAALKLLGQHLGLFPTSPPPTQVNTQNEIYLRSDEELMYFIQHGDWPPPETVAEQSGTVPKQIRSGTTSGCSHIPLK